MDLETELNIATGDIHTIFVNDEIIIRVSKNDNGMYNITTHKMNFDVLSDDTFSPEEYSTTEDE